MTKQMKQNNTIWLFLFIVLFLAGCMSKQEKNEIKFKNLLIECDKQLEFMNDSYNSFGFNPSKAYKVSTEEYDFSIYPSGRMITIKILEFVERSEERRVGKNGSPGSRRDNKKKTKTDNTDIEHNNQN